MAISRFTLTNIRDLIRLNLGEDVAAQSKIADADPASDGGQGLTGLYSLINNYLQSLPLRVGQVQKELGISPKDGVIRLSMWRRPATALTASAGSATVYFPVDYLHWISFYDTTYKREIQVVKHPSRWYLSRLQKKVPGPPERIVIQNFITHSSTWSRQATLYPTPTAAITPTINCEYYGLPTQMDPATVAPTTTYPDIDPTFQDLLIIGPTLQLLAADDPAYPRFQGLEHSLLVSLAYAADQGD